MRLVSKQAGSTATASRRALPPADATGKAWLLTT